VPSSYSPNLRLELLATGENAGTWGDKANYNLGTLLESAVSATVSVPMADADRTLTAANGLFDEARCHGLRFSGALTAQRTVYVPAVQKYYVVDNRCTRPLLVRVAGNVGGGIAVQPGYVQHVLSDAVTVSAVGPAVDTAGNLGPSSVSTLTVPGAAAVNTGAAATPGLVVSSAPGGFALDIRGRASDNAAWLRFSDASYAAELVRFSSYGSGTWGISNAGDTQVIFSTAGNDIGINKNLAVGGTLASAGAVSGGNDFVSTRSAAPTTGAVFFGNSGARYLFWDGANYVLAAGAGNLYVNASPVWHSGNLNPGAYAPLAAPQFSGIPRSTGGRFVAQGAGGNPSFTAYDSSQNAAVGFFLGSANVAYVANMDGNGNYAGSYRASFDASGNLVATGNVSALSDARRKRAIAALDDAEAERVVRGAARAAASFRWAGAAGDGGARRQVGFVAQGVLEACPEAVHEGEDGMLAVSDRPLLACALAALARTMRRCDQLADRLARMEAGRAR
jgi:hypothetical protein